MFCLQDAGEANAHPACLKGLFGTTTLPRLDIDRSKLYRLAAQVMAGKMSISGMQEKVSLTLSADRTELHVTARGGRFILKPESSRFSSLPQNEHLTMLLAGLVGIETPPFGLLLLTDDSPAYIIRRFDRLEDGLKLHVEDFCQLAGKPLRDKYDGSAELCVRLLRKYASEPLIEIQKLFRLFLFSWWMANGDMHLKNFSLLTRQDGIRRLSPAYDLICTQLVIPNDSLSLSVGGNTKKLTRARWLKFAEYCQLPERAARRLLSQQIDVLEPALGLIARSYLPDEMKEPYERILRANTAALVG
jgi:serine/threonine-protein kinase HipA